MRKCFFAGLVTLLPFIVTYLVIFYGLNLITNPFEHFVHTILDKIHLFEKGIGIFTRQQVIYFLTKVSILGCIAVLIYLVGFFAARVFFLSWGKFVDKMMRKIPLLRMVYAPSKELVDAIFKASKDAAPRKALLVAYPTPDVQAVGIQTCEYVAKLSGQDEHFVSVFVPTTPNATTGYLCHFRKTDVVMLDLSADEALKYVLGLGTQVIAVKQESR